MKSELKDKLSSIVEDLGGSMQQLTTFDSTGRTSKKITIEYDVKHEKRK